MLSKATFRVTFLVLLGFVFLWEPCLGQTVNLGSYSLPGSDFSLTSKSVRTVVSFVQSETSGFRVSVLAHGPFPTSVSSGMIFHSGKNVEVLDWNSSSGSSVTPGLAQLLLPCLLAFLLLVRTTNAWKITFIALFVAGIAVTQAVDPAGPYVEVIVHVPPSTPLGNVNLDLVEGSVTSPFTLAVSSLRIKLCGGSASSFVELEGVMASGAVDICTTSHVQLNAAYPSSSQFSMSLTSSNSTVNATLTNFNGTYTLQSTESTVTLDASSCTASSSTASSKAGNCASNGAHTLSVSSHSNSVIKIRSPCPRDPAAGNNVPASPSISSATSYSVTRNSAASWSPWITWGSDPYIRVVDSGSSSVNVSIAAWVPDVAWIVANTDREQGVSLRAGETSTFEFTFQTAQQIQNISVLVVDKKPQNFWGVHPVNLPEGITILASAHLYGPFSTNAASFSVNLNSDVDAVNAVVIIRVMFPAIGSIRTIRLEDMTFTTPVLPPSSSQPSTSEIASVYKMPSAFDSNPRDASSCPHLRSGLVDWHNPSIWPGGVIPSPQTTISIPAGMSVLVSSCSLVPNTIYQKIHVPPTSELIFADADLKLKVRNIHVEGKLFIGGPQCRLNANIEFTFVGRKTTADNIAPTFGSKGIGVSMGGSIDVHGRQYHPSWTRLASPVFPGDNVIYLQDSNNWEVGQSIVIATSIMRDFEFDQNEVHVIKAIANGGKTIQIASPATYYHYAGSEYQTEVGLLSRRIVFQGDEQSYEQNYGGHTRVAGEGRFSGVMTYRMGQKNILGMYPFHFHAMGPSPTSFIRDCSVWNSFFRCIAIHATNSSQALRNIAYNATAHCYYLEDGVEEQNTINYNLAVKINTIGAPMEGGSQVGEKRSSGPDLILPADGAASGFYITNAYNTFIGNAASGGWSGFSFPNLPKPIGLSRNVDVVPESRPTLVFLGNTAHSSGYSFSGGGCIYVGGFLKYQSPTSTVLEYDNGRFSRNTITSSGAEAWMQFNDTKFWMCGMGLSHWGDRVEVISSEAHDTGRGVQLFGESWFGNSLVNAKSESLIPFSEQMGFQFYDTWVKSIVSNSIFRGFLANDPAYDPESNTEPWYWADKRVFTSLLHSDFFKPQGISATSGITFQNSNRSQWIGHRRINTGSSRYFNFVDWDGSFGTAGTAQIIGSAIEWWNYDSGCVHESNWHVYRCPKGNREIVSLDYIIPNRIDYSTYDLPATEANKVGQTYLFGPGIPALRNATLTRNPGVTGVSRIGWYFHTTSGTPKTFRVYQMLNPINQWVMGAWKYGSGTTFTIKIIHQWKSGADRTKTVNSVGSFNDVLNGDGTVYHFDGNHLYIKMINTDTSLSGSTFTRAGVSIYDIWDAVYYEVTATCSGLSGAWCPSTYSHPTLWS